MKIRSFALAVLALAATVLMAFSPTVVPQVALLATTALIMGGAGHSLGTPPDSLAFVNRYKDVGLNNYIIPSGTTPDKTVVVVTPEARILGFGFDPAFTFRGIFDGPFDPAVATGQQNLDACIHGRADCVYNQQAAGAPTVPGVGDSIIVYGYSQSSTIATLEKISLMQQYPGGVNSPDVSFLLTANGNRPNGGILARGPQGLTIPIIGLTFSGPTPTDSAGNIYQTIDISRQYDGWSDQPTNPLNLFAEANALLGMIYLHQNYDDVTLGQGIKQDQVGDTTYYLVPTAIIPLLLPLDSVPVIGHPLAVTLDPFLRVLVEAGYDRTISPGTPTNWNLLYAPNPVDLVHNLAEAIPTGLDNGAQDLTGDRPLGTDEPGPYGVGGAPVEIDQQLSAPQGSGAPVVTGGAEVAPEPDLPQLKRPILTALPGTAMQVQAQGIVRGNPLGLPRRGPVLLDGDPGSGTPSVANPSTATVGAPLKQLSQAVKAAVENVIKPKPAANAGE
jgi:hypothetical protein